ncbi:MAG: tetratricopeptide repeat protein [Opitutaceae bacterium]|nr:tetratricopeptide repeat protein [Opitutaceae bacterium]
MPDVPVSALTLRQQKLVDHARIALEPGNLEYVVEACLQVLKVVPGCVAVRRLHRQAQLRKFEEKSRLVAKALGGLSATPFIFGSVTKNPGKSLESAEKILVVDPTSTSALKLMAEAATRLDLPETAAFALEAVHEIDPTDQGNLMMLGEAWLTAGKPKEALRVAEELLKLNPSGDTAVDLMRKAAIAQTTMRGHWDSQGSFREKLKDEAHAVALEQAAQANTEATARALLDEALARAAQEPNHLGHYKRVVDGYRRLGQLQEALAWVRKARRLPGAAADLAFDRHEAELEAAELETQVRIAESGLLTVAGDSEALARVAAAKSELASYRLYEAKRFSERYPNDFVARQKLGALYLEAGQFDAAIAQFQQTQRHLPVRVASLVGLGRAFKAKQLYDLAAAQFALGKIDLPAMDDQKKEIMYLLGECYELMSRGEQAIAEFKAIYSEDIGYRDVAAKIDAYYAE